MTNRVVLDTNTVIGELLIGASLPRQAFDHALASYVICMSHSTIAELTDVLQRPRFDRYLTREQRLQFTTELVQNAVNITITKTITSCRDPQDNKFLEVAVCGHADIIISGDKDLLVLHPYHGIAILTPRDFLNQTRSTES